MPIEQEMTKEEILSASNLNLSSLESDLDGTLVLWVMGRFLHSLINRPPEDRQKFHDAFADFMNTWIAKFNK